ncbi:MAG TPA: hypothetical protein VHF69_13715, partial [Candidatus Synoicihabitans sp.]|nr:hypothetical protein [Candidatus Synoicihabitans sp.]
MVKLTGDLQQHLRTLRTAADRLPELSVPLGQVVQAQEQFKQELVRLARPEAGKMALAEVPALEAARLTNLRQAAVNLGVAAQPPPVASTFDARDLVGNSRLNALAMTAPATSSLVEREAQVIQDLGNRILTGAPSVTAARTSLGITAGAPASVPPPAIATDEAAQLAAQLRAAVGGFGVVHQFASPEELRDTAQQRIGGLGIAHLKSDLENPAYVAEQFNARVGGFGYTHTFKDEDELVAFAQSRLGGMGVVHKRSDLEDPAYVQELAEQRMGGWGWVHTFKDVKEYRDFIMSRLGGYGRAYTCQDLLDTGMSQEKASAIFDDARRRGKQNFESQEAYEARMLRENPDLFARDANGNFRQLTYQEQQAKRREDMLATGDWVEDPRTGNLVRRDSKAGAQVMDRLLEAKPSTVRLQLSDGRTMTFEVGGFSSLQDAIDDSMVRAGYRRDARGNWMDATGELILSAERLATYDQDYLAAMERRAPGFSQLVTRREPAQRPTGVPPDTRQLFSDLESDIRNGLGYSIRSLALGDATIDDIEVRPGETLEQALRRTLQGNSRFSFDAQGNIIDRRTGKPALGIGDLLAMDERYRERVAESVFGADFAGIGREVTYLAEHGTPEQRAQAQAILSNLRQTLGQVQQVTDAQAELRRQLDALAADPTLTQAQRRAREDALRVQLAQLADRRTELERGLVEASRSANTSAQRAVQSDLSYAERMTLSSADKVAATAAEIDRLRELLVGQLSPTERRNLERRLVEAQRELYEQNNAFRAAAADLPRDSSLEGLVREVDVALYGITSFTAANAAEARSRATGVRFVEQDGQQVAYYVDREGNALIDPTGNLITVTAQEGRGFENTVVNDLARRLTSYEKANADYQRKTAQLDALMVELAEAKSTAAQNDLKRKIAALQSETAQLADEINGYADLYRALESDEDRARVTVRAEELKQAREAAKQAFLDGAAFIEYTDENGNTVRYENDEMRAYRAELARQEASKLAAASAEEQARAAQAAAAAEAQRAELQRLREEANAGAAERAAEAKWQQTLLRGDYTRALDGLRAAEDKLAAAERSLREAKARTSASDDPAARAAVAAAREALHSARAERDRLVADAASAGAIAAANDPDLANEFAALADRARLGAETATKLAETAATLRRTLADAERNGLPAAAVSALQMQLASVETAIRAVATDSAQQSALLAASRDFQLYTNASPDFNAARLDELNRKVRESGRRPEDVLSAFELEELNRRRALSEYHNRVSAAESHLQRLDALAKRDPATLTAQEKWELEQGLTPVEIRTLYGEAQRRTINQQAELASDPMQAAAMRGLVGKWMTDPEGGLTGARPLTGDLPSDYVNSFAFLDRSGLAAEAVKQAQDRLSFRQTELEQALADAAAHPGDPFYSRQVTAIRDQIRLAEERLQYAETDFQRQVNSPFNTFRAAHEEILSHREGYLEHQLKLQEEAQARAAAEQERALEPYRTAEAKFQAARPALEEINRVRDEERARLELRVRDEERKAGGLRGQLYDYQKQLDELGTFGSSEQRKFLERRIRELSTDVDRQQLVVDIATRDIGRNELARENELGAVIAGLPRTWERDPRARLNEEATRYEDLFRLDRELAQTSALHAAKREQFATEIAQLERDLAAARASGRSAEVTRLTTALTDAKVTRDNFDGVMQRSFRTLEQSRTETLARNRADGVGPRDDYDFQKFLEGSGIDPKTAFSADADHLAEVRASVLRTLDAAIASNVTRSPESLASLFVQEAVGENPLKTAALVALATNPLTANLVQLARAYDPALFDGTGTLAGLARPETVAKGAVGGLVGAGKGAVALVESVPTLLSGAAQVAAADTDLLLDYVFGADLGLSNLVGTDKLDAINGAIEVYNKLPPGSVRNLAGRLVDETLRDLQKGDVEFNSGMLGGRIAFELLFDPIPGPVSPGILKAGNALGDLALAAEKAAAAAYFAQATSRVPGLLGQLEQEAMAAARLLNTAADLTLATGRGVEAVGGAASTAFHAGAARL